MKITQDDIKYVIVQAGGKGTRMGHYAENRPKCLVPVNDIPMIMITLKVYKDKEVIIIVDHLADVLIQYLKLFAGDYNYGIIETTDEGTAGGLKEAVEFIPEGEPFILTWADLFFEKEPTFEMCDVTYKNYLMVGLSNTFKCRWRLEEYNQFINKPSTKCGIAGFFAFRDKSKFVNLKTDKSLVRGFLRKEYLNENIDSFYLENCFEVGEIEKYEELLSKKVNHRFFNKVEIKRKRVYKSCIDPQYENVHQNEKDWYKFVNKKFDRIPKIHSTDPLVMEKINGKHAWEIEENKSKIIENCCDTLDSLHKIDIKKGDYANECMNIYYTKARKRVDEVAPLIPYINEEVIKINKVYCDNPLSRYSSFRKAIWDIVKVDEYNVIHGDPTFSNTLVDKDNQIWLIDPRGSFGDTKIYGDRRYDWAKLYYSAVGNYDSMNSKKFVVHTRDGKVPEVQLYMDSNGYEEYADMILERSGMDSREMNLIHASIWLALTGYVKEDIDAAMFSFYMGTYLWSNYQYG